MASDRSRFNFSSRTLAESNGIGANEFGELAYAAGLTPVEASSLVGQLKSGEAVDSFLGSQAYEKLFDYFAFETSEMPYGVAKARTGDPDIWIIEKLEEMLGL